MIKDNGSSVIHGEVGRDITMKCMYELEEDILYSIKWYRDDKEFYRFLPRGNKPRLYICFISLSPTDSPPVTTYFLRGVSVHRTSSPTNIIIQNISSLTSGVFKCEVSAGPPR